LGKRSKNGPDLLDVMEYWKAMDVLHAVSTQLRIVRSDGPEHAVCCLEAVSVWPDLRASTLQGSLITAQLLKSGDMSEVGAALWTLCWRHDVALGKVRWKQQTLPL